MRVNKGYLYVLSHNMFEFGREQYTNEYNKLSYFDKNYVDRVYNNIVRQELY